MPIIATLERFDFSYNGSDPLDMYADIIAEMPRLQWLRAKHGKFPRQSALSETAQVLLKLEHLQFFEWITTDYEPGLISQMARGYIRFFEAPAHTGVVMDDSDSEWSDGHYKDEEKKWMAFAISVTECKALCRLVYRRRNRRSGADLTKIVVARRGHGHFWRHLA